MRVNLPQREILVNKQDFSCFNIILLNLRESFPPEFSAERALEIRKLEHDNRGIFFPECWIVCCDKPESLVPVSGIFQLKVKNILETLVRSSAYRDKLPVYNKSRGAC